MKVISGYVKNITKQVIEKKDQDKNTGEYNTVLKIKNIIVLENNEEYITNKDISFKEGEYIGFTILKNKDNKINYFINDKTYENIKKTNKATISNYIFIFINIINSIIAFININNGDNFAVQILILTLSFTALCLFGIAGVLRYKENKALDIFLKERNFEIINEKVISNPNITLKKANII